MMKCPNSGFETDAIIHSIESALKIPFSDLQTTDKSFIDANIEQGVKDLKRLEKVWVDRNLHPQLLWQT